MKDTTKKLLAEKLVAILIEDDQRFKIADMEKLDILSYAIKMIEKGERYTDNLIWRLKE